MNSRTAILLALAALTCQACDEPPPPRVGETGELIDRRTSVDQIRATLRGSDRGQVSRAIVQLAPMRDRRELRELLEAAWNLDERKYPELNWQVLRSTEVRVAVAQVLAIWEPADQRYLDFVRSVARSAESDARFDALVALGSIATDADLEYLHSVAYGPDEMLATGALSALLASGSEKAIKLLEEAAGAASLSEDRRKFAGQLLGMPRPDKSDP